MSTPAQPNAEVRRLCTSCDIEPAKLADLGGNHCPNCGAKLLEVKARQDELIGQVIDGRFELRARLGQGGMGTVYRAWQRSIGREVAIKLIDPQQAGDVDLAHRFLREARLTSQLSHPNTIQIYDFGQTGDGRLFIAMELVRGKTLELHMLDVGSYTIERAVGIALQVCDALVAAHKLGVIHRDLKLENLMVLDDPPDRDFVKVLDFGIAKSMHDEPTHRTKTGLVVGTPRYMSPEHAMGAPVSAACDLYALGVVLAELLTGRLLWEADGMAALVMEKLKRSPVIDDVPAPIRGLIERMVDPEPKRRPQTAVELREQLLPFAPGGARTMPRADSQPAPLEKATVQLGAVPLPRQISQPGPPDLDVEIALAGTLTATPAAGHPATPRPAGPSPARPLPRAVPTVEEELPRSSRTPLYVAIAVIVAVVGAAAIWKATRTPAVATDVVEEVPADAAAARPATSPASPPPVATPDAAPAAAVELPAIVPPKATKRPKPRPTPNVTPPPPSKGETPF